MSDLAKTVQNAVEAVDAIAAFAADTDEMRAAIKEVGRLLRQALEAHEADRQDASFGE